MEFTLGSLIGIALATMFFGYFFGLFEGRAQGYRRRKKEEPLDRQPSTAVGKAAAESAPAPGSAPPARAKSWLQVYADGEGRPSLDLDGEHVDTTRLTAGQHQRLIQLMLVMRPWVETAGHAAGAASAHRSPETAAGSIGVSGGSFAEGNAREAGAQLPAGLSAPTTASTSADLGAPTSMVSQIDAILQARLEGTALASLGIRLAESRDGGVLVFVGQHSYAGVSDVPDAKVQAAIRSAISDWEKRYTPG